MQRFLHYKAILTVMNGESTALSVAVIGSGYWGSNYVRNFEECFETRLVAVADERQDRLELLQHRYRGVRLTRSAGEVIEDPEVQAVAIATPVFTHHELARAALEAGKHVLVAKPLASSVAEARELTELARRTGLTLLVDHTFLYGAPVRKIRELLERGDLGEPYYFDSVRVNLGLFQPDVNVIWDLAAHDLAIVTYLFGREPDVIHAVGASHSASGLEDVAYVTLRYGESLIAHCHVNWLSPLKIRQTLVAGSEKMLVWNDLAPDDKIRVYDHSVSVNPDTEGIYKLLVDYRMGDMWSPHLDQVEALAELVDHFVACVRGRERPLTDGEFGTGVVRLLEAATRSLDDGGRPVDLATATRS